ncbi:sialidase family protein [Gimesia sp.]|uniref:sialidase family protein n=1 Tax=Gimesia sp. TaxID=2024833 RepID=UPI003A8F1341
MTMRRRDFLTSSLSTASLIMAFSGMLVPSHLSAKGESRGDNCRLLKPAHDQIVCPWQPEHPRHDHQLIFPLDERRLLFFWNNAASPSNWSRTPLMAAISQDEGNTWGHFKDIDARPDFDAAYPSLTFFKDEALIACYSRSIRWKRDSEITLRTYQVRQFYDG